MIPDIAKKNESDEQIRIKPMNPRVWEGFQLRFKFKYGQINYGLLDAPMRVLAFHNGDHVSLSLICNRKMLNRLSINFVI